MKKIVIFGVDNLALMLKRELECQGKEISAFTLDKEYIKSADLDGKAVIPFVNLTEYYSPAETDVYVAIGYKKMNQIRADVLKRLWDKGYTTPNFIHQSVQIGPDCSIGNANIIFQNVCIGYASKIGNGNIFFPQATLAHNNSMGNYNTLSIGVSACGFSSIGNNCFLGASSIVRDGITIADYTLIGAGAYAYKNTKPYDVLAFQSTKTLEISSLDVKEIKG